MWKTNCGKLCGKKFFCGKL